MVLNWTLCFKYIPTWSEIILYIYTEIGFGPYRFDSMVNASDHIYGFVFVNQPIYIENKVVYQSYLLNQ